MRERSAIFLPASHSGSWLEVETPFVPERILLAGAHPLYLPK